MIYNYVDVEDALSLIELLPEDINICNVNVINSKRREISRGIYRRLIDGGIFDETAVRFVEKKKYDLAVHVGEWHTPGFVALIVNAKKKICWIHADLDKIYPFDADSFFSMDEMIDCYYFVSDHSKRIAEDMYPFIRNKTGILHNTVNADEIITLSRETLEIKRTTDRFLFVSVGNIREVKGYIRALEAIAALKKNGIVADWWIVGHLSDRETVAKLKEQISLNNMGDQVSFLGAKYNPYCYMLAADAVLNLSDSESWSLVISEAKVLGIPVIATKTSGALEQIEDGVNGILTSFESSEIAEELTDIVTDPKRLGSIRENLKNDTTVPDAANEFNEVLNSTGEKKTYDNDILYIADDVNSIDSTLIAAQILDQTSWGRTICVYSDLIPTAKTRIALPGVRFYSYYSSRPMVQNKRRIIPALLTPSLTLSEKMTKLIMLFARKTKIRLNEAEVYKKRYIRKLLSDYNCVYHI